MPHMRLTSQQRAVREAPGWNLRESRLSPRAGGAGSRHKRVAGAVVCVLRERRRAREAAAVGPVHLEREDRGIVPVRGRPGAFKAT
eukprot:8700144-Lingulodinium_polyedra.AAC.1